MTQLRLPPKGGSKETALLPDVRQLTIVGGSGAGKTRFMEALVSLNDSRAYCVSAVSAPFPERGESTRPGSIDMLYRQAVARQPYMRTDAVSEVDKLCYMLFVDEFEALLAVKRRGEGERVRKKLPLTKLDRLTGLWQRLYPGNRIVVDQGSVLFATQSGDGLIGVSQLSQGEMTAFYYAAAILYAPRDAVVFIDSPSLFLHPTVLTALWNEIERLRPDCTFVYNSVDVEFVSSRTRNVCVWVKSYDAPAHSWQYEVLQPGVYHEELFVDLIGTRKPVLFIEGDARHSIDARLYPLVFNDWSVRPLGSCDKVIETTRTFNDMKAMHHVESRGIVDRDRRTNAEVDYLRRKAIMVPDVAEVENLFLLEDVIRAMARARGKNADKVFGQVRKRIMDEFRCRLDEQALQHVRHRVKREVECRIDGRFGCITAMETHLKGLINLLRPREQYNELRGQFKHFLGTNDYGSVLKVFNHKPMLAGCNVAQLLGFRNKDEYIAGVIETLKGDTPGGDAVRDAIARCFHSGKDAPQKG